MNGGQGKRGPRIEMQMNIMHCSTHAHATTSTLHTFVPSQTSFVSFQTNCSCSSQMILALLLPIAGIEQETKQCPVINVSKATNVSSSYRGVQQSMHFMCHALREAPHDILGARILWCKWGMVPPKAEPVNCTTFCGCCFALYLYMTPEERHFYHAVMPPRKQVQCFTDMFNHNVCAAFLILPFSPGHSQKYSYCVRLQSHGTDCAGKAPMPWCAIQVSCVITGARQRPAGFSPTGSFLTGTMPCPHHRLLARRGGHWGAHIGRDVSRAS